MALKDIEELKLRGFKVKKLANKNQWLITFSRHGDVLLFRRLTYNKIKDFLKEIKNDEATLTVF